MMKLITLIYAIIATSAAIQTNFDKELLAQVQE